MNEILILKDVAYAKKIRPAVTPTGDTTNTSPTLTNMSSLSGLAIGDAISGAGIPAGTVILAFPTATSITMSANATATAAGITVTSSTLISGIDQIDQLDAGAFAVFTDNNVLLTAANANTVFTTLPDKKEIYFAVGLGDAVIGAKVSQKVNRQDIDIYRANYVAPVAPVTFIGQDSGGTGALNLPALVAGDEAIIRVEDTSAGTFPAPFSSKNYCSYVVKPGETATTLLAAIVAKFNANPDKVATLAVIGTTLGISVTGNTAGMTMAVSADGILNNATKEENGVGASVASVIGNGTGAQVLELELDYDTEEGDTNRVMQPSVWWKVNKQSVAVTKYDLLNIHWGQYKADPITSQKASNQQIIIASPDTAIGGSGVDGSGFNLTDFLTVLSEAFGANRVNAETGS